MNVIKGIALVALAGMVSACTGGHGVVGPDKTRDRGTDRKDLSQLQAGIWVDPQGCEHWFIDDGLEGYADLRRTPDGKPVCNSELPRNVVTGPFKDGSNIADTL
ncbi:hypothetical protein [Epibacterium ulvae]|uniref:hypothetical protein n=1 Tax=Epibacterium ulvae TaxID=1156985 RepID=UPI0024923F4B|nr:hypothetical protein [Epibacterium ulvae]